MQSKVMRQPRNENHTRRGFSLVELLAVVIVMSTLAGLAVPLYVKMTKSSSARVCKANLRAIAKAQAAYAARFGVFCYDGGPSGKAKGKKTGAAVAYAVVEDYTAPASAAGIPTGGLVGAPAGIATSVACPLDGTTYTCRKSGTDPEGVDIQCGNRFSHMAAAGESGPSSWQVTLTPGQDSLP